MATDTITILIVGDPAGVAGSSAILLRRHMPSAELITAADAQEGFGRAGERSVDVLLLDAASANGDYERIIVPFLDRCADRPTVIAVGVSDHAEGAALMRYGAADYLTRDQVEPEPLVRAVRATAGRRRLDAALKRSEARYQCLLSSVTDYTYTVLIENGRPCSSVHGPGCTAVTGYAPEEYAADPYLWYRMIHEPDRDAVQRMAAEVIAGRIPPPLEHRIIHKDGSLRWIRNTTVPRYDSSDRLVFYDGLVSDITERKRAEEELRHTNLALRESELKLQQEFAKLSRAKQEWEVTFDAISDPIIIHDKEGRVLRVNKAYQEAAGMAFPEIIGKPFFSVFPLRQSAEQGLPSEPPLQSTDGNIIQAGGRIYRSRVYPVPDDDGSSVYSVQILEDVTEMNRAEEEIRQEVEVSKNLLAIAETATDSMDLDRLMDRVVAQCGAVLSADIFLSYLWDEKSRSLRPVRHYQVPAKLVPAFRTELLDAGSGFVRSAWESRMVHVVQRDRSTEGQPGRFSIQPLFNGPPPLSVEDAKGPLPWLRDAVSVLLVPLTGKTSNLGLLVGAYFRERSFSERDKRIIEGISREVSLALDEAFLYRTAMERSMELAQKIETLKVIHEIDLSILSSLEPSEILETAVRNIAKIIPCDRTEAMLSDADGLVFTRISGNADTGGRTDPLPFSETTAAEVVATGRPSYLPNIGDAPRLLAEEARLLQAGLRSVFRIPLVAKGNVAGVLSVAGMRPAAFTPEHFATLEQLAGLIGVALENTRLITDLQELFLGTIKSLSFAIDAKSSWTAGHSERVTKYAVMLGRELGLDKRELRDLELTGLLHDVGKLATFDAILDKKERLTAEEYAAIKQHPVRGAELLGPIKQLKHIVPAIQHHHECYDGSGYPDGLRDEGIPGMARILAIADAFDSMTGWRPYRKTFTQREAIEELRRCSGMQFDPALVATFIAALEKEGAEPGGRGERMVAQLGVV